MVYALSGNRDNHVLSGMRYAATNIWPSEPLQNHQKVYRRNPVTGVEVEPEQIGPT